MDRMKDMKLVFLKGKEGRGKSVFLTYIMLRIIYLTATNQSDPLFPGCPAAKDCDANTPLLYFVDRGGRGLLVTMRGISVIEDRVPPKVYYSFAENVDSEVMGSLLTMTVSGSDVNELREFPKKVQQARTHGITLYLPSLNLNDMKVLFGDNEETDFKFKIVEGNPRKYYRCELSAPSDRYYSLVKQAVQRFFGDDYIADYYSTPLSNMSEKQQLGNYVVDLVTVELKGKGEQTDSSFFTENFLDDTIEDPYNHDSVQCASRFLQYVVGAVCHERRREMDAAKQRKQET